MRFSLFKWCNLWLKRLKSSNYTCKSNGYILLQKVQWERVEGKAKHGKQERQANNKEIHPVADVDVVCFNVVYVSYSCFYCISLHKARYYVTLFVYCYC